MKKVISLLCIIIFILICSIYSLNRQISEQMFMIEDYNDTIEMLDKRARTLQIRFDYQMYYIEKLESKLKEVSNPAQEEFIQDENIEMNMDTDAVLNSTIGTIQGPSGKETYYNLDMSLVVKYAKDAGITGDYWVRNDGAKMLGDYILCACDITGAVHDRYDIVETSLGLGICADTGEFAQDNPNQIDIATTW